MAVTQQDIAALTRALANGDKSVRFADGSSVEYHSPEKIIEAIKFLKQQAAEEEAALKRRPTAVRLYHGGRGFR